MSRRRFLWTSTLGLAAASAGAAGVEAGSEARKHRITSADWFVYETGRTRRNYWRPEQQEPVYGLALRLKTDAGAEGGWAEEVRIAGVKPGRSRLPILEYSSTSGGIEATATLDVGTAQEKCRKLLAGQCPAEIETLWIRLHDGGLPLEFVTMADLALWDLCGRIANQPVCRLIGQKRSQVKAYVSSMPNLAGPEAWATHAVACKKRGYCGYKIHPYLRFDPVRKQPIEEFRGFPDQDLEVARAVREAVGPDFPLMFDAAWCYTYAQAERVGRVLDDLKFTWFESPMREDEAHLESYVRLAKAIHTPLCAPQAGDGAHLGRKRWIERGACQVCRADVYAPGGGITSCLILADACARAGRRMDLHAWGAPIYNLQAIAAIPENVIEFQEMSDPDPAGSLAKAGQLVERSLSGLKYASYEPDTKGRVRFPDGPGMGIRFDWDFISSHAWKPKQP